jgi:hypothetical protein
MIGIRWSEEREQRNKIHQVGCKQKPVSALVLKANASAVAKQDTLVLKMGRKTSSGHRDIDEYLNTKKDDNNTGGTLTSDSSENNNA